MVVLLVENDYSLRRAITTFLKKWNVGVLAVGSGDEAKALLDDLQFVPDAFLVDFQLNEKDNGIDLITALQKRYGKIPASIVSANRTPELRQNCAAAGLDLIHKPIDPAVFRAFLESVRKAQSQT